MRRATRVLAAVAAGLTLAVTAPAAAAVADDELGVGWVGPTVSLAWDGTTQSTATTSFVGVPVSVPGDQARRTLVVRNDGPSAGRLTAWLVDVDLDEPAGSTTTFFDDVRLRWDGGERSLRALADAGRTRIASRVLAPGESTRLTVGYVFDVAATSGNGTREGRLEASFDVLLHLADVAVAPTPDPTVEPTPLPGPSQDGIAPTPAPSPAATPGPGRTPLLARTGADVLFLGTWAVACATGGILLLLVARRRRRARV
ncbi:hypothetical protein [Cellulomonas sp. PSBB021]|uniref:hypothetical protein n=1 Tax=Cellulomonas sp. PSBB021 TaxID=2003551 RepID=UPI0012FDE919|nr:hypothetical protein [Cellulomonas sp. PSBB021]